MCLVTSATALAQYDEPSNNLLTVSSGVGGPSFSPEMATSALEFGGSVGKLLWVVVQDDSHITASDADRYSRLAYQVKEQIDLGRASSSAIKAHFDVVGTTLAYSAVVDPEPLSKVAVGVAAWGAKKSGDAIGQLIVETSTQQARAILAQGLKNSGLSDEQLKHMTAPELRIAVGDLKIGGQKLRDILKDDPGSLTLLEAHATDIAMDIGVEALARSEGTATDVQGLQRDLAANTKAIHEFQDNVKDRLDKVDTRIAGLQTATQAATARLNELKDKVQGNTKAIQTLAQISFSGWTTAQKLQAVQSGLFPDLDSTQQNLLIASLKADQAREQAVVAIQQAANDIGNLATIASHLGLPNGIVTGLQAAQSVATGVAKFATGDVLGSISSLTSLVGLGAPDAAAQRHAEMMKYLAEQFAEVNEKLDKIIELQIQTVKALSSLADAQRIFRREVLDQLDRVEDAVLRNTQITQAILLTQWTQCYAFINGPVLNGTLRIPTRSVLESIIGDPNTTRNASGCYTTIGNFMDAWVKPAKWSGQIISADHFPTEAIESDPSLLRQWGVVETQRNNAYKTARDFVLDVLPDARAAPAAYLARLTQPVVSVKYQQALDEVVNAQTTRAQFDSLRCNTKGLLSPALLDLLCFGLLPGDSSAPLITRWSDLLGAALIGPQATRIIDTGIPLSTVVDFAGTSDQGALTFVAVSTVEHFGDPGSTAALQAALNERKGVKLLGKLQWLTEATVMQQAITYGDYTAELAEEVLYDPATRALSIDVKGPGGTLKQKALEAMNANPILARNVVLLALRHSLADAIGGKEKAEAQQYSQTYYALALQDITGPQACNISTSAPLKLTELFPHWLFEYRASGKEKGDPSFNKCPNEYEPDPNAPGPQAPGRGSGLAVSLGNFYVLIPSAIVLSDGVFEQADSLRLALIYRDKLSQELVDRNIKSVIDDVSSGEIGSDSVKERLSFALINEGWTWQMRRTSQSMSSIQH